MSIPVYIRFQTRNDLDTSVALFVQSLRKSQLNAQAMYGDTAWGIHTATGSILIYKGSNFSLRDQSFDDVASIPSSIVVTGVADIVFEKYSGTPSVTGTTTFTSVNNESRSVYVNKKGTISY
jgi:hypothetical protein